MYGLFKKQQHTKRLRKYCYLIFLCILIFPLTVSAKYYTLKDFSILIDDQEWYVVTRENIYNNEQLNNLGISYEYMSEFMASNNIYLDAVKLGQADEKNIVELFVKIVKLDGYNINNLHTYDESEINKVGKEMQKITNAETFSIYSAGEYKYIHIEYTDLGYNINEYITIINGYSYAIHIQKMNPFSLADNISFQHIIQNAYYKYDRNYEKKSNGKTFGEKFLVGALTAAIISGLSFLSNRTKKKKN